jgi:hypothetical protein
MSINESPPRLLEDPSVSAGLRADMGVAAHATVEGFDVARGLVGLRSVLDAEAAAGSAAGTSTMTKTLVGVLLVSGAIALWGATRATGPAESLAVMPQPIEVANGSSVAASMPQPSSRSWLTPPPPLPSLAQDHPIADEPEDLQSPAKAPSARKSGPEPKPMAAAPGRKTAPAPEVAPAEDATAREDSADPSAEAATAELFREAKLVARARGSLDRDAADALRLTERAAAEFPRGQLVEEREALAIRALTRLGRTSEAQKRGSAFLRLYGDGAHAEAVRRALESPP